MTGIKKQPIRPKHIPERTCIACRHTRPKRELVRIVRTAGGKIEVDPTGKRAGRGAYLCRQQACWQDGLVKKRLEYALRAPLSTEDREGLLGYASTLSSGKEAVDGSESLSR